MLTQAASHLPLYRCPPIRPQHVVQQSRFCIQQSTHALLFVVKLSLDFLYCNVVPDDHRVFGCRDVSLYSLFYELLFFIFTPAPR